MEGYSGIETEDAKEAIAKKAPIKEDHARKKVHRPRK